MKFEELKLSSSLLTPIHKLNYSDCTPIQEQAMPHILEGKDLAGLAQTGTGKTAAFLLPLMERVLRSQKTPEGATEDVVDLHKVRGFPDWKPFHWILILVPTRELAEQVLQNINTYGADAGLEGCSIYGGTGYEKQKEALKRGVTFVVATPGRLIDLYKEHNVDLKLVRAVVFDEADRMFDMGFKDDMKFVLDRIPKDRQFLVFSATLNLDVLNTAYQYGASPVEINVSRDQAKAENVEDSIFHLGQDEKPRYLLSLFKNYKPQQTVIFSNFKNQIDPIVQFLRANDIPAVGISSLLNQSQRNRVIEQFKAVNSTNVLVATDVAARGLDIQGVDMVVNFELPSDAESYVHRIGRTGRAGQTGRAFSFVSDKDVEALQRIEDYLKHKVNSSWFDDGQLVVDFVPLESSYDGGRKGRHHGGGDHRERDYKKSGSSSRSGGRRYEGEHRDNAGGGASASAGGGRSSGRYRSEGGDHRKDRSSATGPRAQDHRSRQESHSASGTDSRRADSQHSHQGRKGSYRGKTGHGAGMDSSASHASSKYRSHSSSASYHKGSPHKHKPSNKASVYKVTVWTRLVRAVKRFFKNT